MIDHKNLIKLFTFRDNNGKLKNITFNFTLQKQGIFMQFNIFKTTGWQLILQSDWVCRLILLGLFSLSIFCVAITIYKVFTFKKHLKQLKKLLFHLKKLDKFQDLVTVSRTFPNEIGGIFLHSTLNELKVILESHAKNNQISTLKSITVKDIEFLEIIIEQNISNIINEEESYLSVLATSYTVSPLIGLFGTTWGLIHSFIDIAQEKSADIATVAPGLAEALTTTLAGLLVAIPALIAYHYLIRQLNKIEFSLFELSDKFIRVLKQTLNNQALQ